MKGIVYHSDYNKYDLGLDHPLLGDKPKKVMEILRDKHILKQFHIFEPESASEEDLLRVHSSAYVDRIKQLSKTGGMLSFDTPAPKHIYYYASLATGGSILCGSKLFENYSIMVNPLGGFHHASAQHSSGFCFFNDIAVTIEYLRNHYSLKRFLIIDIDVHHGNGTQDIYYDDPTVLNISIHQDGRTLYPGTGAISSIGKEKGKGYCINLPLPPATGSKAFLSAFDAILPPVAEQFQPQIILFQSGVDAHHADPLANLELSLQTYYDLAEKVHIISKKTSNKLLMLLGGGYNSIDCIKAYYNEFCGLIKYRDIIKEQDIARDNHYEEVIRRVNELQSQLREFWTF